MIFEYSAGAFIYRIENGARLFLLLKKENGEYDVPKGHIEKGESAQVAAKREIEEESGIVAGFLPYFNITTKYIFRSRSGIVGKSVKFFIAEVRSPKVKISYEHAGYEWVTYEKAMKKFKYEDIRQMLVKVNDYIDRYVRISEINLRYAKLSERKGWRLSRTFVPGEGRLDARLMLVGQAPGADEDELKRPFIGRSGKLLDGILKKAKIRRDLVYITSIVQFFPPKNRLPDRSEVDLCLPFLKEQINVIRPKYIILLGNLSSSVLAGVTGSETHHGTVLQKDGITCMVTIHPSAVVRFGTKYGLMLNDLIKFKQIMEKEQ
ncbi:MAG: NUDIX domain-containing protein [Candidatus Micrarchaeota archaeon]|nr:NUDIX domain-containing protein [Candidatus Micrarchaeota archaeon]MDE1860026.1 NUDIX domain-containing protein [Candidatus Micrarchaeota archaeon]